MTAPAHIPTDLVTPLGAYLRLQRLGEASFLLESVEQGRLGRYSFVGCGSRLVSFDEAEREPGPVVGYLGYDYVATLEPSVALPVERPDDAILRLVARRRPDDRVAKTALGRLAIVGMDAPHPFLVGLSRRLGRLLSVL